MEKETLTQRMKDIERNGNLKRASPRCGNKRVMGSLTKTPKSGVSSTTTLVTTPMNVAQNNHWWPSSKKKKTELDLDFDSKPNKGK
jgi:hypothetical protein